MDRHLSLLHKTICFISKFGMVLISLSLLVQMCLIGRKDTELPQPDEICPNIQDWKGIVPGKSTWMDVLKILGLPRSIKISNLNNDFVPIFTYKIREGSVKDFAEDKIFFHWDGTVDWLEVVIADRYGDFQHLSEIVNQVGNTIDTVYFNNNYVSSNKLQIDVLFGPDQVYVWSKCGLVVDILPDCSALILNNGSVSIEQSNNSTMLVRYPNPFHFGVDPTLDTDGIVLRKFLFTPTSYITFVNSYLKKIPYGSLETYIKGLKCNFK
jgi:hypothetical protein